MRKSRSALPSEAPGNCGYVRLSALKKALRMAINRGLDIALYLGFRGHNDVDIG